MHLPWARVWKFWQVLGAQFFGTIVLMKFVLKNPCQQQWIFPGNEAMHVPSPSVFAHRLTSLGRTVFRHNRIEAICPESPCQQPRQRSYRPVFAHRLTSLGHTVFRNIRRDVIYPENPCAQLCLLTILLPPNGALPKLFPTVSLPSPNYFPRFPFRPPSRSFHIAPSQWSCPRAISHNFPSVHPFIASVSLLPLGALPKLFPTVSLPSTLSLLPYRSFPTELSPCHCPRFPICPPCRRFHIVPSSRSSPQTISHAFLPVHLDIASVSLLPVGSSPPCYLPRFPFRPPCPPSRIAPSQRSSPHAISHGFPSVHLVVTPYRSFQPELCKLFPTVSLPSTLSSLPYRSFPPELSPCYFPRFPFRPPCRPSCIAPSHRSSPRAISYGPPCRHSRIAPSHRSSPQAISHGFPSVHPVVTPYRSFQPELSPTYFPRFPFCPPSRRFRIAPSHRSSPQAISHGFPSVHPVVVRVSLLPTGALPKLFPTVSLPSTLSSFPYRSFPQAIPHSPPKLPKLFPTVSLPSTLSSLPYRSFPPELSPCYFPRFPFRAPCCHSRIAPSHRSSPQAISHGFSSVRRVVPSVSLLPTGALPMLFAPVSLPSTLSSFPYRSFPTELSPSYFPRFPFRPPCRPSRMAPSHRSSPQAISHGFPSVHPRVASVSLLPTMNSPQAISTVSLPSTPSLLPYRSFPTELSPCHFPQFPICPPCRRFHIVPSSRSSPQTISHAFLPVYLDIASVSLLPIGSSPHAISHGFPSVHPVIPVSLLPTSHSPQPTGAPQAISHGFPSVHPVVIPVSLLPTRALPKLLPTVSFSSPQAISHGFPSVHPVVLPVSLLPTGALPKLFPTVSLPSTLSSFPYRSFPQAIPHSPPELPKLFPTVSLPSTLSSFPYRSFPPELSPSYFPRFPFRPPSRRFRIAPSPRSSPHAISHGFHSVHPIVASIRSLPTELSPSYF